MRGRWAVLLFALGGLNLVAAEPVSFTREVLPILSDNCFSCHGPDKHTRKSALRLDTREGATGTGKSGEVAIVPGKSAQSEVMKRILSKDAEEIMPPPKSHKTLKPAQIELIRRWIDEGATWGKHWAYEDLKRPAVPAVNAPMVRNPIDNFIAARLTPLKLQPAPEANKQTLIRRLSLDLTGLPPTIEEQDTFAKDNSPDAYDKLVDRLLASPRFGERMAQQWLDVARYADTVGYHGDQNQNAWAYRDYVINSFNANKPFDVFTREQIAGDMLPNAGAEQLTATCFNRLNMMTREGGAQPKEYLAKHSADRVRTVAMTWLGSTFGCAECHDHKFDPISQKDFYSLAAFFADVKQWGVYQDYGYTPNPDLKGWSNEHPFPPEIVVESAALKRRLEKIDARAKEIAAAAGDAGKFDAWRKAQSEFLKKNASGWETPKPALVKPPPPPAPKPAPAKKNDNDSKDEKGAKEPAPAAEPEAEPPAPKPEPEIATVHDDGRVTRIGKNAKTLELELQPSGGAVAAIRVELLPDDSHDKRILIAGETATVNPEFYVERADKKLQKLAARFAVADRYIPRYSNGFEIFGVQSSWKTLAKDVTKPHTAVYFIDPPAALALGESVRVKFNNTSIACVRVSVSPIAPEDLHTVAPRADLAQRLQEDSLARVAWLRSTAANAEAYAKLKAIDSEKIPLQGGTTPVMVTQRTDKPLTIRVLPRGNWQDENGELCQPDTPHFLPKLNLPASAERTRLDLAAWLCSKENPLTPRVVMNRLWKQFFGTGLSAQVDDVGAQGEPPSHPELLDYLALEFRDGGWDMKKMVKLLVMSHTYRQVSGLRPELKDSDPSNRLLASQNPRRLEAEIVRDNALAIAGLINLEMGGPPAFPYQPPDYYDGLQFPDRKYKADVDDRQYRRGVYMHWQRTFLHPMLANFDAPSREDCIAIRTNANSPQQALTLLNDPTFVEAARAWAGRLITSASAEDARLELAFRTALSRSIKDNEKASLKTFIEKVRAEYKARTDDAAKLKKIGLAQPPANVDDVELAVWTSVCRVILNLHETITRY
ncbi:MAG TPA: PSD1 and planctomycete cytochrome C domain-containing protein [Planctomycetota bacterium]|nr:PSD1 and planctomycete cytochrome C domain-containing protein [Planctomycetota bacterium]